MRIISGVTQGGWTDQWEIICPACGDDIDLDYVTVSPYLQRVRGPYPSEAAGLAALRKHRGEIPAAGPDAAADSDKTVPNRVLRSVNSVPPPAESEAVALSTGPWTGESGAGQRF